MLLNLNEFLMSISSTLDFVERDLLGVNSNHGKRTAYISLNIGDVLDLGQEQRCDLVALAIMHDNGVSEKKLHDKLAINELASVEDMDRIKKFCITGEKNTRLYPFLTDVRNVIKYHHEMYDGSGIFKIKGDDIPLMAQIIQLADIIDLNFDLGNNNKGIQERVLDFLSDRINKMFSPKIVSAFLSASNNEGFWDNLNNEYIDTAVSQIIPRYHMDIPMEEIRKITGVFSKIIDSKSSYTHRHSSSLSEKAAVMADFYNMTPEVKVKFLIAASLHDIGKLSVPNSILDSPNKLSDEEFEIVKKHPYYTRLALERIKGFEEITEWASNHHEKLNGKGYPFGKQAKDLDFNSRLLGCLDIYEALTEERPYRRALSHREAMAIMEDMKNEGFIDRCITEDINLVFQEL